MKAATFPRERQEEPQQNGDHEQLLAMDPREAGRLGEELSLHSQQCGDSSDDSSAQVGAADTSCGSDPWD